MTDAPESQQPSSPAPVHNAAAWTAKGDNDFVAAEAIIAAARVPWDTVCFHAQQGAEKYLKALLVAHETLPPRTHDLSDLLGRASVFAPPLALLVPDARMLTVYAVEARYPDTATSLKAAEGRAAMAAAYRLRDAVQLALPPLSSKETSTNSDQENLNRQDDKGEP